MQAVDMFQPKSRNAMSSTDRACTYSALLPHTCHTSLPTALCRDGRAKQGSASIFPIRLSIHRLLFYTPSAAVVRLLTTNFLIAYITSWVLYLSGASEDPRMLLPAWVSIATVCNHSGMAIRKADSAIDSHNAVPYHSAKDQHQKGDIGVHRRLFYC